MALNRWADTIHQTQDDSQHQIRACLHGGGGPQVGEVTRLGGVRNYPSFTCNLTTTPSRGALSQDY